MPFVRAMTIREYGEPSVLHAEDVPKPTPGPRDVLVRVRAAAVNPVDWKIRSGGQRNIVRYKLPVDPRARRAPASSRPSARDVTRFKVGDEVWSLADAHAPRHLRRVHLHRRARGREASRRTSRTRRPRRSRSSASPPTSASSRRASSRAARPCSSTRARAASARSRSSSPSTSARTSSRRAARKNADFVRELGADQVIDYTKETLRRACSTTSTSSSIASASRSSTGTSASLRRGGRMSNITIDVPRHVERYGPFFSLFSLAWAMIVIHVWPCLKKGIRTRHVRQALATASSSRHRGARRGGRDPPDDRRGLPARRDPGCAPPERDEPHPRQDCVGRRDLAVYCAASARSAACVFASCCDDGFTPSAASHARRCFSSVV